MFKRFSNMASLTKRDGMPADPLHVQHTRDFLRLTTLGSDDKTLHLIDRFVMFWNGQLDFLSAHVDRPIIHNCRKLS